MLTARSSKNEKGEDADKLKNPVMGGDQVGDIWDKSPIYESAWGDAAYRYLTQILKETRRLLLHFIITY